MYPIDQKEIQSITDYIFLEDPLKPADAIFIPGCARPEHTREAAKLFVEGYARYVIPSGGYTKLAGSFQGVQEGNEIYGSDFSCEADFLEAVLLYHGVPGKAIFKECESTYTLENAVKTKELILREGLRIRTAILCCKAHHARRAHLYYHMIMPEVDIRIHPVPIDGIDRNTWYQSKEGREIVYGELSRMGQQLAMMEGRILY